MKGERVGGVIYVRMFKGTRGRSSDHGVVKFKNEICAKAALETLNQWDLEGRSLKTREDWRSVLSKRITANKGTSSKNEET